MDATRAAEIAEAWRQGCTYDPDTAGHTWSSRARSLQVLLRDAIPELEAWALFPVSHASTGQQDPAIRLAGVSNGALFRIGLSTDDAPNFQVTRDEVTDLRVTLVERTERDRGGVEIRTRGWGFSPVHGDSFGFASDEPLEGPNARPSELELLCRSIAAGTGWIVS